MYRKTIAGLCACTIALSLLVGCGVSTPATQSSTKSVSASENSYAPVTITVDLARSGLGEKINQTFTKAPTRAIAVGDQLGDILLDLGLEDRIAALARMDGGSIHKFPGRDTIKPIWFGGWRDISKEQLLSVSPDFLIGWDSTFSEDYFNKDFCKANGIAMYTPYSCTDFATFEDIYRDYETLGKIFAVENVASDRIDKMKKTIAHVKTTLGEDAYKKPITIFNYDSGENEQFTACQGMPGDIFKLAGGISIFNDINKAWANVSWEQVVERNPQVIIVNEYTPGEAEKKIKFLYQNKALAKVDAIVNKRIFAVSLDDLEGSCGSADLVEKIATYLYPDSFKN